MRYLLTLCFLLCFTFSHSQEYTKSFSVELDSIDNILASLPPCKDTTIIESAIHRCDELDSLNLSPDDEYTVLQKKSQLLAMLGKYVEGFLTQEKGILRLDTTDIRYLEYFAVKNKYLGNKKLSDSYYDKAIDMCDKMTGKKYKLKKVECLVGKRDLTEAKNTLRRLIKIYNDSDYKMLLKEFDSILEQAIPIDSFMKNEFKKYFHLELGE